MVVWSFSLVCVCERRQDAEGMRVVTVLALCDFIKCICIFSLQHETIKIQFSSIRLSFVFCCCCCPASFRFCRLCGCTTFNCLHLFPVFHIFCEGGVDDIVLYPFAHFSYGYVLPKKWQRTDHANEWTFLSIEGIFRIKNSRHKKRDSNKL